MTASAPARDNRPDLSADREKCLAFHAEMRATGRNRVALVMRYGAFLNDLYEREFSRDAPRWKEWSSTVKAWGLNESVLARYRLIAAELPSENSADFIEFSEIEKAYEAARERKRARDAEALQAEAERKRKAAEKLEAEAAEARRVAEEAEAERQAREAEAERARLEAEEAEEAEREERAREVREAAERLAEAEQREAEAAKTAGDTEARQERLKREADSLAEKAAKKAPPTPGDQIRTAAGQAGKRARTRLQKSQDDKLAFTQEILEDTAARAHAAEAELAAREATDEDQRLDAIEEMSKANKILIQRVGAQAETIADLRKDLAELAGEAADWKARYQRIEKALADRELEQ